MRDVPASATGVITIDLAAIADNWRALAERVKPAKCGAVVKADAYGLGAERVIPALAAAGCRHFFIATPDEAQQARRLAPSATVFVLDGLLPGSGEDLVTAAAVPVLSDLGAVREWAALAAARDVRLPAALQLDSGLNRLGLGEADIATLMAEVDVLMRFDLKLIMSHLACADDPNDAKNAEQLAAFRTLAARLFPAPLSLAASDGLMLGSAYHFDLVRPGYALYGGQAFKGGTTPVRPVVRVEARVVQVRDVADGETVGYSATFRAKGNRRIATIAAGYADGLFRALSASNRESGGSVSINGHLAPIAGRVSMDLITVDVTDVPGPPLQRGNLVCLIGPDIPIEAMGAAAGTIGYEVLTSLGRRFHRDYRDGGGA
jgi:alanine racemase